MHVLAVLTPLDPVSGVRETLRVASAQVRGITGLGGQTWRAAMLRKPTLTMKLFEGDFSANVEPGTASLTLAVDQIARSFANARRFVWQGAAVTIYAGTEDMAWPWPVRFVGRASDYKAQGNRLELQADVDTAPFDALVPNETYAGTTGLEGGENLKGTVKPWIIGAARFVEPVLIDSVDNVFQVSAYAPIKAVTAVYERAASLGSSVGNFASLATLLAANVPEGRWATCRANGLIRLGAPPVGVITADVEGDYAGSVFTRLPGAAIRRAAALAGISSSLIDTDSLDAMDTAVGSLADGGFINLVLREQEKVIDFARRVARACNWQAGVDFDGTLFVTRPSLASPSITLDAQGRRKPGVLATSELVVSPPYRIVEMSGARCWRTLNLNEIAFTAQLTDRGLYDPSVTYREGDIVSLPNGSRWLFVGLTPAAGSTPSDSNPNWGNMNAPLTADNITYVDGTPIEDLKPAEPGATDGASPAQVAQLAELETDAAAAALAIDAAELTIADLQTQADGLEADIIAAGGEIDALNTLTATQGAAIETNALAISNAVGDMATLTTKVQASSRNLLKNPSFANGLTDWGQSGPATPWGVAADTAIYPGHAYLASPAGGANYLWQHVSNIREDLTYTFSGDLRVQSKSAGDVRLIVNCYDAANAVTGQFLGAVVPSADQEFDVTGATREAGKVVFTAPMTTTNVEVYVAAVGVTATQVAVRELKLEIGDVVTRYTDEVSVTQTFTAISSLDLDMASLETLVATQGAEIETNAIAISSLDSNVATLTTEVRAGGGNLLSNTDFASDTSGWALGGSISPDGYGRDLPDANWHPTGEHALMLFHSAANGGDTSRYSDWVSERVSAEAFKYYEASNYAAMHRCRSILYLGFFDASDNNLSYPSSPLSEWQQWTGGNQLSNWGRQHVKAQAPAGTAFMHILWRKFVNDNAGVDSYGWMCRPQIREVSAGSVGPTAYRPGNAGASIRQQASALSTLNTEYASLETEVETQGITISTFSTAIEQHDDELDLLFAKAGVRLDVNNYVTGWELNNNGSAGSMTVNADYFAILKPGGGNRYEYYNGVQRIITGSMMLCTGIGLGESFGTTNQFVMWYGPVMALSACNEAQALYYIRNDGAMFYTGYVPNLENAFAKLIGAFQTSAWAQVGTVTTASTLGAGQVAVAMEGVAFNTFSASATIEYKIQYSTDRSSWIDVSGTTKSLATAGPTTIPRNTGTLTGLTANRIYYFRVVGRVTSGDLTSPVFANMNVEFTANGT